MKQLIYPHLTIKWVGGWVLHAQLTRVCQVLKKWYALPLSSGYMLVLAYPSFSLVSFGSFVVSSFNFLQNLFAAATTKGRFAKPCRPQWPSMQSSTKTVATSLAAFPWKVLCMRSVRSISRHHALLRHSGFKVITSRKKSTVVLRASRWRADSKKSA